MNKMIKNRIMTTKELADYIKLNEKTVLKMANEGKLPGIKIGSQWRFHLDSIDAYIQNDILQSNDKDLDSIISTEVNITPVSRLISQELINIDLKGATGNEVIYELVRIAMNAKLTSSEEKLVVELKKREKMLSTAIGNGVAIPHPRHPSEEFFKKPNIILGKSSKGIDFKAPDKKPVYLFFMTCAPTEYVHLRLLAKISKLLHRPGIVESILKADNKKSIIQILLEFDRDHVFSLKKH